MRKWKIPILFSIGWLIATICAAAWMMWYITTHPIDPLVDEARADKAGYATGIMLGMGWGPIWGFTIVKKQFARRMSRCG